MNIPELLCPAGNLEKLKVAVGYGADAVYLGGEHFGLRVAADNFTDEDIADGTSYAHDHGRKVYVTLNGFLHDKDLEKLPLFGGFLREVGVDGLIISDMGTLQQVKDLGIPLHLSTQAGCFNSESATLWKREGISRVILGREVSLKEAGEIKRKSGLAVEVFIHGSLCSAYSGHCIISNFTAGRDSNRGGCAHSCRFHYSLTNKDRHITKSFMNSKDLSGLTLLGEFIDNNIDAIKIEGRMKGLLYLGVVSKVYSDALNSFKQTASLPSSRLLHWEDELKKIPHRLYTTGALASPADFESIYPGEESIKEYTSTGVVLESNSNCLVIMVKSGFERGDSLELLPFKGNPFPLPTDELAYIDGTQCHKASPGGLVKLPAVPKACPWNIIRQKKMNLVSFIHNEKDWTELIKGGIKEVIISPLLLSRLGSSSMEQIKKFSTQCLSFPFRCVLLWDTLPNESDLKEHISLFTRLPLKNFNAIRVLDTGVFHYLRKKSSFLEYPIDSGECS